MKEFIMSVCDICYVKKNDIIQRSEHGCMDDNYVC